MDRKRGKGLKVISLFQIILMVGFVFAFSSILNSSFVGAAETSDEDEQDNLGGTTPAIAVVPVNVNLAEERIVVGGLKNKIWDDKNILIKSATKNKITGLDLTTGDRREFFPPEDNNVFDLNTLSTSIAKQQQINLIGKQVTIDETTYSLYHASLDLDLRQQLIDNPSLLENTGIASLKVLDDGNLEITRKNGAKDVYTPTGELDSSTGIPEKYAGGFITDPLLGNIIEGFGYALLVVGAIQTFGSLFGVNQETTNALSQSAAIGLIVNGIAKGIAEKFPDKGIGEFLGNTNFGLKNSAWIGIGVTVLVFLLTYKKEKQETVVFSCLPWQAPLGGNACGECNSGDFACSEYQCRSLGQSCELINKGTHEEKCVWINRDDVNPPIIQSWQNALLNNYRYAPDNAVSPPDRGVKILYEESADNCVPAFTPLRFGVTLDEPATCKLDTLRKDSFDEMSLFMSSGIARDNHSYALSLPSAEALASENISIQNNGNFELYVRCQDSNGNSNTANFQFRYCVDQGPDTTAPLIAATSLLDGAPIAFGQKSVEIEVYVNEPSECKWDHNDRSYDSMEEDMSCSTGIFEYNAQMLYKCSTTLTGLKDKTDNKFYFRCKDNPGSPDNERNENTESQPENGFTLVGTRPLVIDSVEPNNTVIKDSTDSIKVTIEALTSSGYKEGESVCYYSDTGNEDDYIKFFNTNSHKHSQELFLSEGQYDYFIRCVDLGGNADTKKINFDVETDLESPKVVRAFKENDFLKLITDEKAECVYSIFGCIYTFTEGTQMNTVNENNHFTDWDANLNLYVKCQDDFGNQPLLPNQCSIVVKASDFNI